MTSRNQREGRYIGRLQGLHGQGKQFVRCRHLAGHYVSAHLGTAVWSRSAGLACMQSRPHRNPWSARQWRRLMREMNLAAGRPASFRASAEGRERLRQLLGRGQRG